MSPYHAADTVSLLSLSVFLLRINKLLNYRKGKKKKRTEKKIIDWSKLGPAHIEHPSNHRGRAGHQPRAMGKLGDEKPLLESQGRRSLVGCCLRGRTESDTTDAT